jgi:hypothetical protein
MRELTFDEMELVAGGKSKGGGGGGKSGGGTKTAGGKVNKDGTSGNVTNINKSPKPERNLNNWSCTVSVSKSPSFSCTFGNSW